MPVYKDSRRGTFYYSFSVDGKRIRSKDFKTKAEANKALAKAVLNTDYVASENYTFNQVTEQFLKDRDGKVKIQSLTRTKTRLDHFLKVVGDVRVDKLTVKQYQDALNQLDAYIYRGKPLSNAYKNKVIRTFKQLCAFAKKRYDLVTLVPDKFDNYRNEEKKEMKFITLDQFKQLMEVVDDVTYKALFTVLFFMGSRLGETLALTWEDIDFEKNELRINKTVTTKMKGPDGQYLISTPKTKSSVRSLPLPEIVSKTLLELHDKVSSHPLYSPSRFVFGFDKPISESTIQNKKRKYFQDAKLEQIRIHDFRHSCASFLINNNATPLLVSKWLGHANVSMTLNTYSHLWKSELDEIVNVINSL